MSTPSFDVSGEDVVEFHGVQVRDPYRWIETADSREVSQWVEQQDALAGEFLERETAIRRCRAFVQRNHVRVDPPWRCARGERVFYLSRRAGLPQPLICQRRHGVETILVDPNASGHVLDPDNVAVSPSGGFVAFALSLPGEVLATLHTYDVNAGSVVESSELTTVAPMIAWHPSERGYYYSRCRRLFFPEERHDGVYWHAVGDPWEADSCIKPYNDWPGHLAYALVPDGGENLLLVTRQFSSGCSGVGLCRLEQTYPQSAQVAPTITLFDELESTIEFIGVAQGRLHFQTCSEAPTGKVVAIDPSRPERSAWTTVVAANELSLGRPEHFPGPAKAAISESALLLTRVEDANDVLFHYDVDGGLMRRIELPVLSTVDAITRVGEDFHVFTQSFLVPRALYRYACSGPQAGRLVEIDRVSLPDVDLAACDVRQVFYPAQDGTRIPMYLLQRKDAPRDAEQPLLLYGYGGFGQAITPECVPDIALWLDLGGIYAIANIRGGGEYGEAWHAAGCRIDKQTSFDDFYAAAEYLIAERYTSPAHLCTKGISNGGLLTAVCVNQRPDLFAAVVSEVPLVDMFALERSEAGRSCFAEYGDARQSRAMFDVLRGYSPLHNLRADGAGPPQLVVVAEKDISAPPVQAYRYVAARQANVRRAGRDTPVLLRLIHGEGHTKWHHDVLGRIVAEEIAFLHRFVGG